MIKPQSETPESMSQARNGWTKDDVRWKPIENNSAIVRTHRLNRSRKDAVHLSKTLLGRIWGWMIFFLSLVGLINFGQALFWAVFFISTTLVYVLFWKSKKHPIIFDKKTGYYRKQHRCSIFGKQPKIESVPLGEIIAIQVIQFKANRGQDWHFGYELNLILESGKRQHVVTHGSKNGMLADANKVADFLSVLLWTKTNSNEINLSLWNPLDWLDLIS